MLEALVVNPYDASAMAEAFFVGLTMPREEQRERMRRMREVVRSNNVFRWAGNMLLDAARLRKREQLLQLSNTAPATNDTARTAFAEPIGHAEDSPPNVIELSRHRR